MMNEERDLVNRWKETKYQGGDLTYDMTIWDRVNLGKKGEKCWVEPDDAKEIDNEQRKRWGELTEKDQKSRLTNKEIWWTEGKSPNMLVMMRPMNDRQRYGTGKMFGKKGERRRVDDAKDGRRRKLKEKKGTQWEMIIKGDIIGVPKSKHILRANEAFYGRDWIRIKA
jgi:hypothetical protein